MTSNRMKARWAAGEAAVGMWVTSNSPVAVETLASLPFDYITLDLQHGMIGYGDVVPLLQALRSSEATLLARVPWNEPGIIGKVLDAGVQGVIIPMVNTEAQAEAAARSCRYAPTGARSFGPIRAARSLGPDYFAEANDDVLCIPMIETVEALGNLDAILDTAGVDAVYIGPADLSITLGLPPGPANDDHDSFAQALQAVLDGCRARRMPAGIHSVPAWAPRRLQQGFDMVTVSSDLAAYTEGARRALDAVGGTDREAPGGMY